MTPGRYRSTQPASLAAVLTLALVLFIILLLVVAVTNAKGFN